MDEYTTTLPEIAAEIRDTIPCRCCGLYTLRAYPQMGVGTMPAQIFVECRNPGCPIYTVTRSFTHWLTMDLADWHCREAVGWQDGILRSARQENLNRVVEALIDEHEEGLAATVRRDFHEQLRGTLPYRRREVAQDWFNMYHPVGAHHHIRKDA